MDVVDTRAGRMVAAERREVAMQSTRAVFYLGLAVLAGWSALHPVVLAGVVGGSGPVVLAALWVLVGAAGLEGFQAAETAVVAVWRLRRWRRHPELLRLDVETEQAVDLAAVAVAQAARRTGSGPVGGRS